MLLSRKLWVCGAIVALAIAGGAVLVTQLGEDAPDSVSWSQWQCKASNGINCSSSTSSIGWSRLNASHLAVLNETDHPLTNRAAEMLAAGLRKLPFVEDVSLHHLTWPSHFETPPGLFIRLGLRGLDVDRSSGDVEIDASVKFTLCMYPWTEGNRHSGFPCQMPVVRIDSKGTLHHQSTNKGSGPAGSEFAIPATGIGEQITGHFTQLLTKWHDEHGVLPPLPASFSGRPGQLPGGDQFDRLGYRRMLTYYPLYRHGASFFLLDDHRERAQALKGICDGLKAIGFDGDQPDEEEFERGSFQMRRGDERIRIMPFEELTEIRTGRRVEIPDSVRDSLPADIRNSLPGGRMHFGPGDEVRISTSRYIMRYEHWMSPGEMQAAIDDAFDLNSEPATLLMLRIGMNRNQRNRLLEVLDACHDLDAKARVELVGLCLAGKQEDRARRHLSIAAAAILGQWDNSDLKSQLEKYAEELGDKSLAEPVITPEKLREAGFREIGSTPEPTVIDMQADDLLKFFCQSDKGAVWLATLRITEAKGPDNSHRYTLVERGAAGGKAKEQGGLSADVDWSHICDTIFKGHRIFGQARKMPQASGFQFRIKVEDSDFSAPGEQAPDEGDPAL